MKPINYGRKKFVFYPTGNVSLECISIIEKPLPSEDEQAFTQRLIEKYKDRQGTMEIVFKNFEPNHAIITFS